MRFTITTDITDFTDALKTLLTRAGISKDAMRRVMVIAFEAGMNMVWHGGGGFVDVSISPCVIHLCFKDCGPGIPDISRAMTKGYSTAADEMRARGFGGGAGLYNINENAHRLKIISKTGNGTIIEAEVDYEG